ncbi:MAG: hypothetical protein SLAVMIC_00616 [uncultured marine phage]|uniref:Uncharacterized protein n=1 Tax=uncultured marine phage TaxID=707152 RepID=A0A8D9FSA6_9VIRU|nr:MAG: hypothetical protein SLAVMIC_00616 [uncultured marine phage]
MNNLKINENLNVSITNYLGQLEEGVVVLLSVKYNDNIYEATYWYDSTYKVLTLEEKLENEIEGEIEGHDQLMEFLDENTSDFDEIYSTLDPIKL